MDGREEYSHQIHSVEMKRSSAYSVIGYRRIQRDLLQHWMPTLLDGQRVRELWSHFRRRGEGGGGREGGGREERGVRRRRGGGGGGRKKCGRGGKSERGRGERKKDDVKRYIHIVS